MRALLSALLMMFSLVTEAQFAPQAGYVGSTAIAADSNIFKSWVVKADVTRGWQDISDTSIGLAYAGADSFVLGRALDNPTVSLGDAGYAIVQFPYPIMDGNGFDFAVFENAFIDSFLELAFVEVSSDGVNFFRFNSTCNVDTFVQLGNFGLTDATKINNLAGKYLLGYGTPFDLSELKGISGLDINRITHLKIVDVVGSINGKYGSRDSRGHIINNPWPTPFASSGFDLDAVGVINEYRNVGVPLAAQNSFSIYPNPVKNHLYIQSTNQSAQVRVLDMKGMEVLSTKALNIIDVSELSAGVYVLQLDSNYIKFIKE
ncbi:MAG: T9SS type A sorting domain-containing protein [Bacteroidetes bacterium]|nr:T9SS type A sorting domain-containing protein [Bacteroidota bacterium]